MKIDVSTYGHPLREVPDIARRTEAEGWDAWLVSETVHDPMLAMAVGALATERLHLGTAISVAFARNPMTVAYQAQDIQHALGDRPFILGLGSQIKPHIRKRFSMDWPERPATAMREFVEALHAIWDCWDDGVPLDYRGEVYQHTLMTPMFTPEATAVRPRVWIAAVGPGMTRVTGQVADGILCHGFTTATYMAQTTMPALQEGIARVEGRTRADVEVVLPLFTITGYTPEQTAQARGMVLQQIGFYGSTPAYRPVLEAHGWGDLGEELTRLSKTGGWAEMAALIPDEVVDAFAIVAEPDQLGDAIAERFGGTVDRISMSGELGLTDAHRARLRVRLADA